MNKKGLIGVASACVTVLGVFFSYLEAKEHEDHIERIEKQIHDVEALCNGEPKPFWTDLES
jgi:hypothetical protein